MPARTRAPAPSAPTRLPFRGRVCVALGSTLALSTALWLGAPGGALAGIERIAAVVNDEPISGYDLEQRIRLVVSSSGVQPTEDVLRRIEPQILRGLVEEHLELQEAIKQKISIDDKEVEQALGNIAQRNHMSAQDIGGFLAKSNIDVSTLKNQIRANLAWTRLVSEKFGGRIYISDEDIKAEYARLQLSLAQPQFLISEIVLRVDSPDQDEEVHKTADRLLAQLHGGAEFDAVAQQFSQSSTAATGGDLGWVERGQLAVEMGKALADMKPGQISEPIRTPGAYHIVFLRNAREAGKIRPMMTAEPGPPANARPVKSVQLSQLLIPLPPHPAAAQSEAALARATAMRAQISGCGNLGAVVAADKGVKLANLPMTPFSQIAPFFQRAVMMTGDGQASQPFQSPMGIHILVVCKRVMGEAPKEAQAAPSKPVAAAADPGLPSREEIEGRLYNQQLSMMSRRYLRDLRRDAVVDYR